MGKSHKGANMSARYTNSLLTGPLFKMLITMPSEPKKEKKKPSRQGNPTIPDAVVLELRRLCEHERWSYQRILQAYPQYDKQWIRRILGYELRAALRLPDKK